ncbi:hypothetical protein ALC56_01449 [Trachymyrmex septentrionalis]|uniref:Odorant receptor n=1 Tax=Trachymyrmex septentrionalis TaxID=34720 RepID=A0A195FUK4_9HYME|nr:hypothetical protein ALC56_01449 [Trachymyrmex septentrionalis]
MDNVDKFFRESHYNIIQVLLSVSGLWPYHTTGKRCAIYFAFLLILGSGMIFEVLGTIEILSDSLEVIDCLPMLVLSTVSISKLICAIYTLPEIRILLTRMRQYWYSPKSDEETKILLSYAMYGKKLSYVYTGDHTIVFLFTTLLSKLLYMESSEDEDPSSNAHKQVGLPYHVNYMIDPKKYYIPIFVHVTTCVISYTILMLTFDVLYMTLIQHCCGLFVALSTEDVNHLLKHTSYLSALLLNTFFENWQGQKIIDSSEKVYESAYNAEWYKMPIAQRKLFIMIIMKSRKSLKITAGNFVNLSYVNFNAVSKTIA